jgi:hypothetical protein
VRPFPSRANPALQPGTYGGAAGYALMLKHESKDHARAERLFKAREQQKADAPKATADYYAAEKALRERTEKLRRLRLARLGTSN